MWHNDTKTICDKENVRIAAIKLIGTIVALTSLELEHVDEDTLLGVRLEDLDLHLRDESVGEEG